MRDYCVAVAAVVPLLLLVVAVESGLLARLQADVRDAYAAPGFLDTQAEAVIMMSGFWSALLRFTVFMSMLTVLGVLVALPFMPEGGPHGLDWAVFVLPLPTVALLVLLAGFALIAKTEHDLGPPV